MEIETTEDAFLDESDSTEDTPLQKTQPKISTLDLDKNKNKNESG